MKTQPCVLSLSIMLSALLFSAVHAATGDPVLLNEILASHTGTDDTEFVELFGTPGASLAGLSLIIVEGDALAAGIIDRRLDFKPFQEIGPNGFFLVGNCVGLANNYGLVPDKAISDNFIENSSLTVALVKTASLSNNRVTGTEVVLDTVALQDPDADADGDAFFFEAPVLGPDDDFFPAGARRFQDGFDTDTGADWVFADFRLGSANTPTGGGQNGCEPLTLTIPEIQGAGERSSFAGETVTTSGVVTLLTRDGRSFWIQDPDGDANPATSDGIFVYRGGDVTAVKVGDHVTVTASVAEFVHSSRPMDLPLTELRSIQTVSINTTRHPLPRGVALDNLPDLRIPTGIGFWEPLEGMRAEVQAATVVAATSQFGEFALLTKHDARPGSGFFPHTQQILLRSLGDNQVDYNPERIIVDDESITASAIQVIPGDRVRRLTGVVDYTFSHYKLQPSPESFEIDEQALPEPPVSQRSGPKGDLRVTTFNVENLFDRIDNPDKDDEGSTPSAEELETKLTKLTLAIVQELKLPAILIVQEIENTQILRVLGDRVNTRAGTHYQAVSFETSDARGIEVGFLWDAERVELVDAFQLTDAIVPGVSDAFGKTSASPGREPLVGVFAIAEVEDHDHGKHKEGERKHGHRGKPGHGEKNERLTIVGNHFKSKGGDDPLYGINQPPIRITEEQRKLQAQVVRDFVDLVFDADPEAKVMVAGDLNDFPFGEPGEGPDHPLAILEGLKGKVSPSRKLTNLIYLERAAERFTFVFDGNSQVLDHMLVSRALLKDCAAVDILHFNAGFPAALEVDPNTPIRASDHDAVELRLKLDYSISQGVTRCPLLDAKWSSSSWSCSSSPWLSASDSAIVQVPTIRW